MGSFSAEYIETEYCEDQHGTQLDAELVIEEGDTSDKYNPNDRELAMIIRGRADVDTLASVQLNPSQAVQAMNAISRWLGTVR